MASALQVGSLSRRGGRPIDIMRGRVNCVVGL